MSGPLATVMVLTCNRPKYTLPALRLIAAQDCRPIEVLVVDDGTAPVEPLLRAEHPDLQLIKHDATDATTRSAAPSSSELHVRLLVMPRRESIGEKRTAAVHAARGEVILHLDGDLHDPRHISAQVSPIANGEAGMTALQLSHHVAMPSFNVYEGPLLLLPALGAALLTSAAWTLLQRRGGHRVASVSSPRLWSRVLVHLRHADSDLLRWHVGRLDRLVARGLPVHVVQQWLHEPERVAPRLAQQDVECV